jgi:hypothetical protein
MTQRVKFVIAIVAAVIASLWLTWVALMCVAFTSYCFARDRPFTEALNVWGTSALMAAPGVVIVWFSIRVIRRGAGPRDPERGFPMLPKR